MNDIQILIFLIVAALGVMVTRFLPFMVFRKLEKIPPVIDYLGRVLPAAMMGLLVVYCFKDVNVASVHSLVPSLIATILIVVLHLWKRNTILSISLGTIAYMLLLRIF